MNFGSDDKIWFDSDKLGIQLIESTSLLLKIEEAEQHLLKPPTTLNAVIPWPEIQICFSLQWKS